ncbi:MAG TPA: hypothetical protein VK875_03185 [Euzebyales bacterium]|nr:hypothetical protein [Euzebyales bacterium]
MTERIDQDATAPMDPVPAAPRPGAARVNLLPHEVTRERRRQQIAAASIIALVAYVAVLGVLYALKVGDVAAAQDDRDAVEAEVAVLQAEVESLAEFQTLVEDIQARESLLTTAMSDEMSWARVFGNLALSFTRDASLIEVQAMTAESTDDAVTGDVTVTEDPAVAEPPPAGTPVGQITFTGYSIDRVAPGVEEVLLDVGGAEGLFDSYLITTTEEERGDEEVTSFEARVDLNDEVYTHRYDDGLPQESIQ